MSKIINFDSKARKSIQKGIDILANSVKVTLGPQGRNVIIEKMYGAPQITKDGVTVAKEVELKDPFENIGAQLIKEVSSKTCNDAGDGTTTSTVLAQAIINEGIKSVESGINPIYLRKGINTAVSSIVQFIKDNTITIKNDHTKIVQVASISANNDTEIGNLIADAFDKVSAEGIITIEESKNADTYTTIVEGLQLNRGYVSPYFANINNSTECILEDSYILIYNDKIKNLRDILPILEIIVEKQKSLLIIANDYDSEVIDTLVANKIKNNLKVCAIKSPGFGELSKELLLDIAAITGSTVMSEELNHGLSRANITNLGYAKKIIIDKNNTTIIQGNSNKGILESRVNKLKQQYEENPNEELKTRIAKLSGGVAILYVGANSEVEMREKKDRVEDALCATRAALEEGIIPGGGTIYLKALKALRKRLKASNEEEQIGINIVCRALSKPLYTIAQNAGVSGDVVVQEVYNTTILKGYNAKENKYVNMLESGIIDPAKVTRVALENAASIAGLILTTGCVICNEKE